MIRYISTNSLGQTEKELCVVLVIGILGLRGCDAEIGILTSV